MNACLERIGRKMKDMESIGDGTCAIHLVQQVTVGHCYYCSMFGHSGGSSSALRLVEDAMNRVYDPLRLFQTMWHRCRAMK